LKSEFTSLYPTSNCSSPNSYDRHYEGELGGTNPDDLVVKIRKIFLSLMCCLLVDQTQPMNSEVNEMHLELKLDKIA
jgi:hypothetical protein